MPFRTRELLECWVADFLAESLAQDGRVHRIDVLDHAGDPGEDTGLVVVRLGNATTEVYLQPVAPGDPRWQVGFGARDDFFVLGEAGVRALSAELALTADLCCYLERRSVQQLAERGSAAAEDVGERGTDVDTAPARTSA